MGSGDKIDKKEKLSESTINAVQKEQFLGHTFWPFKAQNTQWSRNTEKDNWKCFVGLSANSDLQGGEAIPGKGNEGMKILW